MVTRQSRTTDKIAIPKIRPASWRVYVQGEHESRYVGGLLGAAGMDVSEPKLEPGLIDPPLYAIVATPQAEVALTREELLAVLEPDAKLILKFDAS